MIRLLLLLSACLFGAMYLADNLPERSAAPKIVQTIDEPLAEIKPEPVLLVDLASPMTSVRFSTPAVVAADGTLIHPMTVVAAAPELETEIPSVVETPEIDVRFVTANRVNVRSGPSTNFAVVDQVVFADAVEIITDAGNGWVNIRIEGDGVEGFMSADFLQYDPPE